jgi:hypothetical protein
MSSKKKRKKEPNVPAEMYEAWKRLIRPGEGPEIAKFVGVSYPTVYSVLRTRYSHKAEIIEGINKYLEANPRPPIKDTIRQSGEGVMAMAGIRYKKPNKSKINQDESNGNEAGANP